MLTSFDPIHSPTAKEPPDQVIQHVPSYSPIHSGTNSATSTPSSSTKRSSRRRTMLFSSSVCTVSKGPYSQYKFSYWSPYPLFGISLENLFKFVIEDTKNLYRFFSEDIQTLNTWHYFCVSFSGHGKSQSSLDQEYCFSL